MECFLAMLQKNVLDSQRWGTREELRLAIISWLSGRITAAGDDARHWEPQTTSPAAGDPGPPRPHRIMAVKDPG